jgi:hypothetical protein
MWPLERLAGADGVILASSSGGVGREQAYGAPLIAYARFGSRLGAEALPAMELGGARRRWPQELMLQRRGGLAWTTREPRVLSGCWGRCLSGRAALGVSGGAARRGRR